MWSPQTVRLRDGADYCSWSPENAGVADRFLATEPDEQQRLQYASVVDKQFEHLNAMMRETLAFARGERELLIRKVYLQGYVTVAAAAG